MKVLIFIVVFGAWQMSCAQDCNCEFKLENVKFGYKSNIYYSPNSVIYYYDQEKSVRPLYRGNIELVDKEKGWLVVKSNGVSIKYFGLNDINHNVGDKIECDSELGSPDSTLGFLRMDFTGRKRKIARLIPKLCST